GGQQRSAACPAPGVGEGAGPRGPADRRAWARAAEKRACHWTVRANTQGTCRDAGATRAGVESRGKALALRTFLSSPAPAGPFADWFVVHCPSGAFVQVAGFVPLGADGQPLRPVTPEEGRRLQALASVTDLVANGVMGASLADAPALFRDAGLAVNAGRGMGASCACTTFDPGAAPGN
ncbi:MAG TPA: hypothetical protein PKD10_16320, partial [Paracoccaceae bacterium]|nr:hypothetical protein [Paracoccaceae bacterium]